MAANPASFVPCRTCVDSPECGPGTNFLRAWGCVFFDSPQAVDVSLESGPRYDEIASGLAIYAYVNNDPLNRTDPSGQFFVWDNLVGAGIGAIGGGISGGIAGYHATGTWQGAALGAGGGAVVGGAIGAVNPLAVGYAIEAAGGAGAGAASFVAGAATFTAVNAVGGAAGAAAGDVLDYQFAGGSLTDIGTDVRNGAIIGAASGVLEAPFVAAGGGAALGYGAAGDAALSAQSAIFGTLGTIATTCSVGTGCGPTPSK